MDPTANCNATVVLTTLILTKTSLRCSLHFWHAKIHWAVRPGLEFRVKVNSAFKIIWIGVLRAKRFPEASLQAWFSKISTETATYCRAIFSDKFGVSTINFTHMCDYPLPKLSCSYQILLLLVMT